MSKKKKKKQKKKRRAPQNRPTLPAWYDDGIQDWSDEQIFNQLRIYGLERDGESFKQDAMAVSEPSNVAVAWVEEVESDDKFGELFFHLSAISLWKLLLPNRDTFELATDDLLDCINERNQSLAPERTKEDVTRLLDILDRFLLFLNKRAEEENRELMDVIESISEDFGIDADEFLVNIPVELKNEGFVDEAVLVARKYAFVNKECMMADLGEISANAGRCDEALEQEEEKTEPSDPAPVKRPKTGRNEPCPCGSGLKYKKCCLSKKIT